MLILIIFSFLAGIFTILSPCILPILPVILSAGTTQGKMRPLGIILGLVVSFTFFTLTLTGIVRATGLSINILRYIAIVFILVFGIIMIFPSLSSWFSKITAFIANLGQRVQGKSTKSGFLGGIIFGFALGLLWTPCAGPILAAITTLVATQSLNWITVLMTLSYSIGAGIPMFIIAYGGSKIIQSSQFLTHHSERIRQFFGCIMILTAGLIAFHWDELLQQKISSFVPTTLIEDNEVVKKQLKKLRKENPNGMIMQDLFSNYGKAPEITGITYWINSPPLSLDELKGKVVLIDFWTYSCINCLRTIPYIKKWAQKYEDQGLVVIGIHTPEFEFEKSNKNVSEAVSRLGITYPVAQDNHYQTWENYNNHYWPAHYLIDQEGDIRLVHFGEGAYLETENGIRKLLNLPPLQSSESLEISMPVSPETYLGLARGKSYTSEIKIKPNQVADYDYNNTLELNKVGLKGEWLFEQEKITAEGDDSYLDIHFLAKNVYLVLSNLSSIPMEVYLDGEMVKKIQIDSDRKYDIVSTSYGKHQLSLKVPKGVSAYAFTFGNE